MKQTAQVAELGSSPEGGRPIAPVGLSRQGMPDPPRVSAKPEGIE